MAHKTAVFSMTSAAYREVSTARLRLVCDTSGACMSAILPGTQFTCYRKLACGICELGLRQ